MTSFHSIQRHVGDVRHHLKFAYLSLNRRDDPRILTALFYAIRFNAIIALIGRTTICDCPTSAHYLIM